MSCKLRMVGIIGAGPAGISAAVQLGRWAIPLVIYDGQTPGGLIRNAWRVENIPVLPPSSGQKVRQALVSALKRSGADVRPCAVKGVDFDSQLDRFILFGGWGQAFCHTLIVASGTEPLPWSLQEKLATECQQKIYREVADIKPAGKTWLIIGSGDAAFDYALSVADGRGSPILACRGRPLKASLRLQNEVKRRAIKLLHHATVRGVQGCGSGRLRVQIEQGDLEIILEVDGLLVAIGRQPTMPPMTSRLAAREAYLRQQRRLWTVGDACGRPWRYAANAMGEGLTAATMIADTWQEE